MKELYVEEGHRTSLQRHFHRAEYWIVVEGEGKVVVGEEERDLRPGDVVVIPRKTLHRVEGGKGGIRIVEVWVGEVLDEEDIERVEDDYGRV